MFYRSNQSVSKSAAYTLRGTESHIDTQSNQEKGFGFSLRCVAGSSLTNADTPLLSLPLSYIRSGFTQTETGTSISLSTVTNIWAAVPYANNRAHMLIGNNKEIGPNSGWYKGEGRSLRCVRPLKPLKNHNYYI